ncbi:MAG: helicase, partial [Planctomycetes bacterium]|nr:helicase [Planctomycetota bacterium]
MAKSEPESPAAAFFGPQGPLARTLDGFKERVQQTEMAVAVETAVRERHHLIVEAGTGVGKSLGYLVPALLSASPERRRIVISTHTISLQEQLIGKDLPSLKSLMPQPFHAVVAKGRNNYLAPRRLDLALSEAESSLQGEKDGTELRRIQEAWRASAEGTRQEIDPQPDPLVWESVQSEHGNCLGRSCLNFEDRCSYQVARRNLGDADLIVVNHSLYMADLVLRASGARILPDHDVVVFDEAHTLENVALDHFGARLSRRMLRLLMFRIGAQGPQPSYLANFPGSERARRLVSECLAAGDGLFERIVEYVGGPSRQREVDQVGRIHDELSPRLHDLASALVDLKPKAGSREREVELVSYIQRVDQMRATLFRLLEPQPGASVHWAEVGAQPLQVSLHMKPLEVDTTLKELLFDRVGTVVLTSATLSIGRKDGLAFIAGSVGATAARQLVLGSPFDFKRHVRLRVPTWLDEPQPTPEYDEKVGRAVVDYVERAQGGAFVLFTSYQQMRRVRDFVADRFDALGFPLLVQGGGMDRRVMVERFRESQNSVLFGTDSFWQGVDVQGKTLRLVIITRLPFPVPGDPLNRARSALVRE